MNNIQAMALFCEDIRREAQGRDTLIGVFSDSLRVRSFPGALRRVQVYVRIRLDPNLTYDEPISVEIDIPGEDIQIEGPQQGPVPKAVVEQSIKRAREQHLPYATLI